MKSSAVSAQPLSAPARQATTRVNGPEKRYEACSAINSSIFKALGDRDDTPIAELLDLGARLL
jgi:hypothetical protein